MHDFLKFYDETCRNRGWALNIYHSSIVDWHISIGYKSTHPKYGERIITAQDCDIELAYFKVHY